MKKDKKPDKPDDFLEKYKQILKKVVPWLLAIVLLALALSFFKSDEQAKFGYNDFIKTAQEGQIETITIEPQDNFYKLSGKLTNAEKFTLVVLKEAKFENLVLTTFLSKYSIRFTIKDKRKGPSLFSTFLIYLPIFILIFFFLRLIDAQSRITNTDKTNKITDTRFRHKLGTEIKFKDVAGLKEAKEELQEIIDFLKNPTQFSRLGGRVPRGVLLAGPTGTGKTLLARAVAGEAGASFFSMSGSEFVEMFVGVGASRVRKLFSQARKDPPAIIFIDEIDAVGRHRGAGLGGGHDEREQTLNQILVEMDGFDQYEGIVILAATNRPDMLDKAILRPGRFDRKVFTNLPDIEDREAILRIHTRNKPLAPDVDLKIIARGTPLFSGADLENLVNEAALKAARKNKNSIEMEDMEWAKDKVLMGAEKKIIITEEEKRSTAFHETGHALVTLFCPNTEPLHKVSIIPRGQALGITVQLPLKDKYLYSKQELEAKLTVLMGGRAAEEIFLNKLTTGASNDIEVATGIAQKMVCDFGMSDLGPLSFGKKQGEVFLGKDYHQVKDYSEDTAKRIDKAIESLVDKANQNAKNILEQNKDKVEKLVKLLLEKETLDGKEVKKILKIKAVR